MDPTGLIHTPSEWPVALAIRPRLLALLREEARHSGRDIDEVLIEALREFLRTHPVSWR